MGSICNISSTVYDTVTRWIGLGAPVIHCFIFFPHDDDRRRCTIRRLGFFRPPFPTIKRQHLPLPLPQHDVIIADNPLFIHEPIILFQYSRVFVILVYVGYASCTGRYVTDNNCDDVTFHCDDDDCEE